MSGYPWGGSEELWYKIANEALKDNYSVGLLLKNWGDEMPNQVSELKSKGILINYLEIYNKTSLLNKLYNLVKYKLFKIQQVNKNIELLNKYNPDVIIVNFGGAYDISGYQWLADYLLKNVKRYFIIQQYNTEYSNLPFKHVPMVRSFFEKAHKTYFVSMRGLETTKRNLVSHLHNAKVVSNPLKIDEPKYLKYPNITKINFACVARLQCNIKCQDMLLEAFSKPEWENRSWHLNFYGKGDDLQFLKELTQFYNLNHKVTFHNHVNDIDEIWANNHIMILPSIAEGTPLSLIEAMFLGRIAIVTDVGGNTELIDDDINGYIIRGSSVSAISEAINRAWNNKGKWEDMGKQALQKAQATLNINSSTDILKDIKECM